MSWASEVERESADLAEQALQDRLGELRAWAQEQLGELVTLHQRQGEDRRSVGVSWISGGGVDLCLTVVGRVAEDIIPALRRLVSNQAAATRAAPSTQNVLTEGEGS